MTTSFRTAMIVFCAILASAATIWLALEVKGEMMPGWAAAMGPPLLAATLVVHLRRQRK